MAQNRISIAPLIFTTQLIRLSIAAWGITAYWAWCAAGVLGVVVPGVLLLVCRFFLWRGRRRSCAQTLAYARKARLAFGKPDFGVYELIAMRRCQRDGDFRGLSKCLLDSDANLRALEARSRG